MRSAKRMFELAHEFRHTKNMSARDFRNFRSRLVSVISQTEDDKSTEWLAYAIDNCELEIKE